MAAPEHRRVVKSVRGVRHQIAPCFPGYDVGLRRCGEGPEAVLPSVYPNVGIPCIPLVVSSASNDAPILRFAPEWRDILTVGVLRKNPQVHTSVVKAVAIGMVAIATVMTPGQAEQFSVQEYGSSLAVVPEIGTRRIAVATERPSPLSHPLGIGGVNDGVRADRFSILAVQGDQYGQTVFASLKRRQRYAPTSLVGTAVRATRTHHRRGTKEGGSADQTRTLNRHRDYPSVSDPGCLPHAGVTSCLYFTMPATVIY